MRKVRFILGISDVFSVVNPIWADDLAIGIEKPQDYKAIRESLEGELVFKREDYDLINAQAFDQKFTLDLQVDTGSGFATRIKGYFFKTYLKVNVRLRQFTLAKFVIDDYYERLMNGIDQEFNLTSIGCPTSQISFFVQPILQIYQPGNAYVTNLNSGNSWESPVTPESDTAVLTDDYFFSLVETILFVPGSGELVPDISGTYFFFATEYRNGDYSLIFNGTRWQVFDTTTATLVYDGVNGDAGEDGFVLNPVVGSTPAKFFGSTLYTRILTNADEIDAIPTVDFPAGDFVNQSNYAKIFQIAYSGFLYSDANTTEQTGYGIFSDISLYFAGRFFAYPSMLENYFPVNKSSWRAFSTWVYFNSILLDYQIQGSIKRTIRDAYKFSDVLDRVIAQIDPTVRHFETTTCSDFLYSPGTNPVRGNQTFPFIVPKTNITVGDYDLAAKKAPITLKNLLDLIQFAWNAFWYIDEDGNFIVEHVSFFENGKSYSAIQIETDLTVLLEPKNNLPWSYVNDEYSYAIENLPERIEWAWQEQSSELFDGLPVTINSAYVNPATVEKRQLSKFYSDIDFALANDVTKDGLFYIECTLVLGEYESEFATVVFQGRSFFAQNAKASFAYLVDKFGRHNLPAPEINISGFAYTALSVKKGRVMKVAFAGKELVPGDYLGLVRTDEGDGEVEKAKVQVSTGIITIEQLNLPTQ